MNNFKKIMENSIKEAKATINDNETRSLIDDGLEVRKIISKILKETSKFNNSQFRRDLTKISADFAYSINSFLSSEGRSKGL